MIVSAALAFLLSRLSNAYSYNSRKRINMLCMKSIMLLILFI